MAEWCNRCKVQVWSYYLMPNHVHLIVVPESEDGLRRALGEAHRRYTISGISIFRRVGRGTSGREDLLPSPWMSNTYRQPPGTLN
jgi:REP element-mobilizing transposase RayT